MTRLTGTAVAVAAQVPKKTTPSVVTDRRLCAALRAKGAALRIAPQCSKSKRSPIIAKGSALCTPAKGF